MLHHFIRPAGLIAIVLLTGTLAGCAGKSGSDTATTNAAAQPATSGPGSYRIPTNVCSLLDFTTFGTVFGTRSKDPEPALAANQARGCKQSFNPRAGSDLGGLVTVTVVTWRSIEQSRDQYALTRTSATKSRSKDGKVTDVGKVGEAAFHYVDKADTDGIAILYLIARDSNATIEVNILASARQAIPGKDRQQLIMGAGQLVTASLPRLRTG